MNKVKETSKLYTLRDYNMIVYRPIGLPWTFTEKDIEWINMEIGPYDFSLYNKHSIELY